ncbi:MAG: hypothetical protein GC181_14180 [Bacteroidetes bacterium]|nr:hypothetical protein [Bacteroidota bacterium]
MKVLYPVAKFNKIAVFFFVVLLCNLFQFASGQKMEWSNTRKLKGNAVFTSVIGENSHGIFLLRYRNKFLSKNIIIERYRHQMGLALTRNIVLKKARLLHIELQDDRLLVISSRFNRKETRNEVMYQWYTMEIEPIGDPELLFPAALSDYYDKGDFRVRISNNRKRISITHTEKSDAGKRILQSYIYDDSLKLIRHKSWEIEMPYDVFYMSDMMIDNGGNLYYLVNNREQTLRRNNEIPIQWQLFTYSFNKDALNDFAMADSGVSLLGPSFSWDRFKNKVNITAFYTDKDVRDVTGLYNFVIYPDSINGVQATYNQFTPEFKNYLTGNNNSFTLEEVRNFKIIDVIPNSDGGISIVAERSSFTYESDVTYVNGVPQTMSRNIYNYEDVLVMAMDPQLRIRWFHLVNKSQSSLNDGGYYSSIIVANTRSKIYIIYNDRLRTNGDVIQYTFTTEGEVTHKILIRSDEEFVSVIPREASQIAYNKLLLPVSKNKKFALLKLEYPN